MYYGRIYTKFSTSIHADLNLATRRQLNLVPLCEMKPDYTAGAPAPACVAYSKPAFFRYCFVGYLVYPKISKLLFFDRKSRFIE
jgi:hypothetical protein